MIIAFQISLYGSRSGFVLKDGGAIPCLLCDANIISPNFHLLLYYK